MLADQTVTPVLPFSRRKSTRRIILHDSHKAGYDIKTAEHWLRWRGRQLGLLDIGYHFIIGQDGECVETRPHATMGSHCGGFNHDSIGVCMIGEGRYSSHQIARLTDLVLDLRDIYGLITVHGHSELIHLRGDHACPIHLNMNAFRDLLDDATARRPIPPVPPPAQVPQDGT